MIGSSLTLEDLEVLQARLGETMSMNGYPLDESECRRVAATAAGYLTWEDAVRSVRRRTKTYVVHCSFAFDDEARGRTTGWFEFFASAPEEVDLRELIAKCRDEIGRIRLKAGAASYFPSSGSFSIDDIVELDVIPARGAILNYRSVDQGQRVVVAMVPTDDLGPEIRVHSLNGPFRFDAASGELPSKSTMLEAPGARPPIGSEGAQASAAPPAEIGQGQTGIVKRGRGRPPKMRPA